VRFVLLGLPGSGKGTQGTMLAQRLGVPHIATGDIVRDHIARGTEFGRKVEAAIAGGDFAPDSDILYWVYQRLAADDAERGYVLDGFPRDTVQAEEFDRHNEPLGVRIDAVIDLIIPEALLIERLTGRLVCPTCGDSYHIVSRPPRVAGICDRDGTPLVRRQDDEPLAIKRRFDVYNAVTLPLRDYYRGRGLLAELDAVGAPEEVFDRILLAIEDRKRVAPG
jgi:adenylate kinase